MKIAGLVALLVLLFVVLVAVCMWLWNWLMPDIFGLPTIGYFQAGGLLVLSSMLFGSWGSRGK